MASNKNTLISDENRESEEYKKALDFLYSQLPMFSRTGAAAYKPGLDTSLRLDEFFGHPHKRFKSIHVGGTNGKGSTSSMLAAVLQSQGYKTGLYTSPHLVDFRERMRINGEMIPQKDVVDFVERWKKCGYEGHPSFFELTMMMAFDWFAKENVDYAIIEVGMGGRLDSTNIITPLVSVITNISPDHTQFLGTTLTEIAGEKAGIIKAGVPVVIGESLPETKPVFEQKARDENATIIFADENPLLLSAEKDSVTSGWRCLTKFGEFVSPLGGVYQKKNINTTLHAIEAMKRAGIEISDSSIVKGLENVETLTGFAGRWTILEKTPLVIADTGHNIAGLSYNMQQLKEMLDKTPGSHLHFVIGFVADKDVVHILSLLPKKAFYYVTQAQIPRALPAEKLFEMMRDAGFSCEIYADVDSAYSAAKKEAKDEDVIYVGGSTFIVADLLASFKS